MPDEKARAKVTQYLNEAQATEQALIQTLQAHIAVTPRGSYRDALEGHLEETGKHWRLLADRIGELAPDRGLIALGVWAAELGVGVAQGVAGRLLAVGKAPIDILRSASAARTAPISSAARYGRAQGIRKSFIAGAPSKDKRGNRPLRS